MVPDPGAYGEARRMGYDQRSTQRFAADGRGMNLAMAELSRGTSAKRAKLRRHEAHDAGDFFEGDKAADEDREERGS